MLTKQTLLGVLLIILCWSTASVAIPVGSPDLKKLTAEADLIIVGEVIDIKQGEITTIEYKSKMIDARKMHATFQVDHTVKGSFDQKYLLFEFPIPGDFLGQRRIDLHQFGMFFFKAKTKTSSDSSNGFTLVDFRYPCVVAVPGESLSEGSDLEKITAEFFQVLMSVNPSRTEYIEAFNHLITLKNEDKNLSTLITEGLRNIVRIRDFPLNLEAAQILLGDGDLSYLDLVVEYVMNPPSVNNEPFDCIEIPLLKDPKALPTLIRLVNLPCDKARKSVFNSIEEIGGEAAIEPLIQALYDRDQGIRYRGVLGLARITRQTGGRGWGPGIELFEKDEQKWLTHWREWAAEWKILQEKNKSASPPPSNKE